MSQLGTIASGLAMSGESVTVQRLTTKGVMDTDSGKITGEVYTPFTSLVAEFSDATDRFPGLFQDVKSGDEVALFSRGSLLSSGLVEVKPGDLVTRSGDSTLRRVIETHPRSHTVAALLRRAA